MPETKLYTPDQINEDVSIKTNSDENSDIAQLDLSVSPRAQSTARVPTVDAINNMFSINGTVCTINRLN